MKINVACIVGLVCSAFVLGACEDPKQNQPPRVSSGGSGPMTNSYSSGDASIGSTGSNAGGGHDSWIDASKADSSTFDANRMRRNILFVYDCSGSMGDKSGGEPKYVVARKAIQSFVSAIPEDNNLGLVAFHGDIREHVPLGTNNRAQFMAEINGLQPGGSTPLRSAITMGYDKLRQQGLKQLGYGEYVLVIVADGEADNGQDPRGIVEEILGKSPVTIYAIGFNISGGHSLNQPGRTIYREARNQQELEAALRAVVVEEEQFVPLTTFESGN